MADDARPAAEQAAVRNAPALGASPSDISDPRTRHEFTKAAIWAATIGMVVLAVYLSSALLTIFGAMVVAGMIDGGARLLGRVVPWGRGIRIAIVLLLTLAFIGWLGWFAGSTISKEAAQFPTLIEQQLNALAGWARSQGIDVSIGQLRSYADTMGSGVGTVTRALGGIFGGLTTTLLVIIIGIYVAVEPHLYQRGVAWMLPEERRDSFYITATRMGHTMRRLMAGRLLGMVFEAALTYVMLAFIAPLVVGKAVPMAFLLALITGLLAFIPNIGALVSGVLMMLVGFSGGADMGIFTIVTYLAVQNFDGYVVVPMIAKKTVDLAPALVLGMQLIMGILFGVLGLLFADPLLAMIKVALERRAEEAEEAQGSADTVPRGA